MLVWSIHSSNETWQWITFSLKMVPSKIIFSSETSTKKRDGSQCISASPLLFTFQGDDAGPQQWQEALHDVAPWLRWSVGMTLHNPIYPIFTIVYNIYIYIIYIIIDSSYVIYFPIFPRKTNEYTYSPLALLNSLRRRWRETCGFYIYIYVYLYVYINHIYTYT